MFASVVARRREPQKKPSNPKRLRVDPLEGRDVPATVVDPLATFSGSVDAPRQPDWVQMQVQTSSRVLLAFETDPAAGSSFQPGQLKMFEGEGAQSRAVGAAGGHGFALATVTSGFLFARARGAGGSTGAFDVNVTLAGDVNGDHQVDAQDLDLIRSLRGVRRGQPGYLAAADVNHNGVIGSGDLQLAERNLGRTATVGPITADQFLFAGRGPRLIQFNPTTMSGISLVIDGINDSTTPIHVDSFAWSVQHNPGGPPTKSDLQVTAPTGVDSPLLFKAAVTGSTAATAALFVGRVGSGKAAKPKLEWDMDTVQVTSYQTGGSQHPSFLEDAFSLSFTKLKVTYTPTLPTGQPGSPVSVGFNFLTGQLF
jgi:type VI protein secretion system component Hcp